MDAAYILRLLAAAALVTLQSRAAAQLVPEGGSASREFTYGVPASCADAASWIEGVVARLEPDARELGRRELPSLVESVQVTGDGKRALLRLRGAGGVRVVVGEDCAEVLDGAALIAALAFGSGPPPQPAIAPEPRQESAALEPPLASPPLVLEKDRRRVDAVAVDSGPRQQAPPTAAMRSAIGAGAGTHTGLAPWPATMVDAAFELSWPERGGSLRARGSMGFSRTVVQQRSARFVFVVAGVDLCPVALGAHLQWQWRNCIGFELGRVHAEGETESALRTAEKQRMWWAAPSLVTRLQSPALHGIRFEVEAGGSVPLWHSELEFRDPDVSVFETPAVALTARLGLQVLLE